jgi:hypothetical protein
MEGSMKNRHLSRFFSILIIIVCALSITAGGGGGVRWKTERVDAGKTFRYMTNSSSQLYGNSTRVAYGSDHLYYAYLDDLDSVHVSTVDSNWGVGMYASLAINPTDGHPQISYYDQTHNELKYAAYKEVGGIHLWSTTYLYNSDPVNLGGKMSAIALDHTSAHLPHIIYRNIDGEIRHAWMECPGACNWYFEEVDSAVDASGTNIGFAIDASDVLHVAYYDIISNAMYYRTKVGGVWSAATHLGYGIEPSLTLDSNGYPSIAYRTTHALMYAYSNGSVWTFATIYDESGLGKYPDFPSLELNGGDSTQPEISFIDGDGYLRLAYAGGMDPCPGASADYDCEVFDFESTYNQVTSLSVSDSNLRSVVYMDAVTGDLRLMHEHDGSSGPVKSGHIIDSSTDVGHLSSLVVDANGPHIGYYDQHTTAFKYAEFDNSVPGGCGEYSTTSSYRCDIVSATGDIGGSVDVGISSNGYPHLVFYDPTIPVLQYATLYPNWNSAYIDDSSADVGKYASLAFSPLTGGRSVIAYMDVANGKLKYAQEWPNPGSGNCGPGNFWNCEVLNNTGPDSFGISLTIGSGGYSLISYVDSTDHLVKVARYLGPSNTTGSCTGNPHWNCETIAPGYLTEWGETSIWADTTSSIIWVSWHYSHDATLMWSQYTVGSGWQTPETVDQAMYSGEQNSLTESGNLPVIAYTDGRSNDTDLMLAYRVGGGDGNCGTGVNWYCETLDSTGVTGFSPSIQNNSGRLYISYYDYTNGDLKLMFQAFPYFVPLIKKP